MARGARLMNFDPFIRVVLLGCSESGGQKPINPNAIGRLGFLDFPRSRGACWNPGAPGRRLKILPCASNSAPRGGTGRLKSAPRGVWRRLKSAHRGGAGVSNLHTGGSSVSNLHPGGSRGSKNTFFDYKERPCKKHYGNLD